MREPLRAVSLLSGATATEKPEKAETAPGYSGKPKARGFHVSTVRGKIMRVEPIGEVYRVILGKPLDVVARALVGRVEGATLTRAVGFWQGNREESTVLEIAGLDWDKVADLASALAFQFGEECAYVQIPGTVHEPGGGAYLVYPV